MTFRRIDPTSNERKKIKSLYKNNYSYYNIAKALNVSRYLIIQWIKKLKISKINKCSWCGRRGKGKSVGIKWLCKKCDKHRCINCKILLSDKRMCKRCDKKHGGYDKKTNLCLDCGLKKQHSKLSTDKLLTRTHKCV